MYETTATVQSARELDRTSLDAGSGWPYGRCWTLLVAGSVAPLRSRLSKQIRSASCRSRFCIAIVDVQAIMHLYQPFCGLSADSARSDVKLKIRRKRNFEKPDRSRYRSKKLFHQVVETDFEAPVISPSPPSHQDNDVPSSCAGLP